MTRADLLALADRVETEEPSAVLLALIAAKLGWVQRADAFWLAPNGGLYNTLPDWLRSLDAAASLAPSGAYVSVEKNSASSWECCITLPTGRFLVSSDVEAWGRAPTEPQARTAAALRARAQEGSHD